MKYDYKIGLKKAGVGAGIFLISLILTNWDSITSSIPAGIRVILGMSVAAAIKMGLNMLKIYLKNKAIA